MRWSLLIATYISFLLIANAFVIPSPSEDTLAPRTQPGRKRQKTGLDVASKKYRETSKQHSYAYEFNSDGTVTRKYLRPEERLAYGNKILRVPKTESDHILEKQLVHKHLAVNGMKFDNLDGKVKTRVSEIVNDKKNLTPIPKTINAQKGSATKNSGNRVSKGDTTAKAPDPERKTRTEYMALSYPSAKRIARRVDRVYKKEGVQLQFKPEHKTLSGFLSETMRAAGIFQPGQPSPPTSPESSQSNSRASSVSTGTSSFGSSSPHRGRTATRQQQQTRSGSQSAKRGRSAGPSRRANAIAGPSKIKPSGNSGQATSRTPTDSSRSSSPAAPKNSKGKGKAKVPPRSPSPAPANPGSKSGKGKGKGRAPPPRNPNPPKRGHPNNTGKLAGGKRKRK